MPVYDISQNGRTGDQHLDLDGSALFVADGIFAQEIVPRAREAGLLADALCLRQHPVVTFWRRLTRDLREHRKPPLVLVRRGLALMRAQRLVVDHAVALGCRPMSNEQARRTVAALADEPHPVNPLTAGLRQPDARSCGAASLVMARATCDPSYGAALVVGDTFRDEVLTLHRRLTSVRDRTGRLQVPWPRALGTPPWAAVRELGTVTGHDHVLHVARWSRAAAYRRLAVSGGALYVGSGSLPRHVVLVLPPGVADPPQHDPDALACYQPSVGRVVLLRREELHRRPADHRRLADALVHDHPPLTRHLSADPSALEATGQRTSDGSAQDTAEQQGPEAGHDDLLRQPPR